VIPKENLSQVEVESEERFHIIGASGIVDYVKDYIYDGDYLLISKMGLTFWRALHQLHFLFSGKSWVNNHAHVLKFDEYATRRYVEMYLNANDLSQYITGAAQPKFESKKS
jgi:type I restriction enzyme S subunit